MFDLIRLKGLSACSCLSFPVGLNIEGVVLSLFFFIVLSLGWRTGWLYIYLCLSCCVTAEENHWYVVVFSDYAPSEWLKGFLFFAI